MYCPEHAIMIDVSYCTVHQVDFEPQWLEVIRSYIAPVQVKVFPGYNTRVNIMRQTDN